MSDRPGDTWDLEAVYDAEIAPLMTQIIGICKAHGMPMVASFMYASNDDGDDMCTSLIPRGEWFQPKYEAFVKAIRRPASGVVAITVVKGELPGEGGDAD